MVLDGCRVLVVEDSYLVATATEAMLESAGCRVVGPFGRLDRAMPAARTAAIDAALLDVDIRGELVFPVADALEERGIPFAFVTGGDTRRVRTAYPRHPIIRKPLAEGALRAFLAAA